MHRSPNEALRAIAEATAATTGGDFFRSLVLNLARAFDARYAFVTECSNYARTRVRTLALVENDEIQANIEYDLAGRPCAHVIGNGQFACFPENVAALFPQAPRLHAYVGAPVMGTDGMVLGHLVVADDKPLECDEQSISIMTIYAARAGAELERQRAMSALRENERKFRTLFEAAPVAIGTTNAAGQFIQVNRAFQMLFSLPPAALTVQTLKDIIHPDDVVRHNRLYAELVTGGRRRFDVELRYLTRDGNLIWSHTAVFDVRDNEGHFLYAIVVIEDISERKRIEATLERRVEDRTREIEQRRRVAEGLREVLTIINSNRTLNEILDHILAEADNLLSSDASALFRIQEGEFVIQATHGIGSNLHLPPNIHTALREGQAILVCNLLPGEHCDSPTRCCRPMLVAPVYVSGRLYGSLALFYEKAHDFSDEDVDLVAAFSDQAALAIENAGLRQRVEQAAVLDERERLARELHDSVTQSLYSLSLLAEGWRRMAETGKLPDAVEPLNELGEIAQQALKEMRLLVHELRPPALQTSGLLGALLQRLNAVEKRAGLEVRLEADDSLELPAEIEETLYRIAQEALNNALKHAASHSIAVRVRDDGQYVEMEVEDDGQGFDPATASARGGIGLISMRERTDRLGGVIEINSESGAGTRVYVRFAHVAIPQ